MREILELAWQRFNLIGAIIGDVQSRILVTAFYFTVLVPFGLASRLFTDPLHQRASETAWIKRDPVSHELDAARQQG